MSCVKITDLQFANPLVGNEVVPVVQQGTSYQVTVSSIGFNADINGENNTLVDGSCFSSILGGCNNSLSGNFSILGGGLNNTLSGNYNTIIGGKGNRFAEGCQFEGSNIIGGENNTLSGNLANIFGGESNTVSVSGDTIIGGKCNTLSGEFSVILGGYSNTLCQPKYANFFGQPIILPSNIIGGKKSILCSTLAGGHTMIGTSRSCMYVKGLTNTMIGTDVSLIGLSPSECAGARNLMMNTFGSTITGCGNSNTIIGGNSNSIHGPNSYNSILNGVCNRIVTDSDSFDFNSTIINGFNMTIIGCPGANLNSGGIIGVGSASTLSGTGAMMYTFGDTVIGDANFTGATFSSCISGDTNFLGTGINNFIKNSDDSSILAGRNNRIIDKSCVHIMGTSLTAVSSNMLHTSSLFLSADRLPTSDPGVPGVVWQDSGTLKISI